MHYKDLMSQIFGFNPSTYYSWKKENRPIIKLINTYFNNKELLEFLETGQIRKFDYYLQMEMYSDNLIQIFKDVLDNDYFNEESIFLISQVFKSSSMTIGTFAKCSNFFDNMISNDELFNLLDFLNEREFFSNKIQDEVRFALFDNLKSMVACSMQTNEIKYIFLFIKIYIYNVMSNHLDFDTVKLEIENTLLIFNKNKDKIEKFLYSKEIQNKSINEITELVLNEIQLDIEKIEIEEKFESKDSF